MEPKRTINCRMPEFLPSGGVSPLPESPREPMEFLSRSWSASALEITNALSPLRPPLPSCMTPPNGDNVVKFFRANNSINSLFNGGGGRGSGAVSIGCTGQKGKTVGRWLKDRKERKKEEQRIHNAQLHATISVASVSAAVAAIMSAKAASSTTNKDDETAKINVAIASAATLVAVQCVEAAEAMGAERNHLASVVGSAANVRSHDDITTLTAAAATALRGAATLKERAMKEVWNISSMTPLLENGIGRGIKMCGKINKSTTDSGEIVNGENFPMAYSEELLARGVELLKRTRNGDLHWKIVSAYLHHTGQVMLKMKSKHVAGTITKKNKNVVVDVCTDLPAWPGRNPLDDDGERRRYFGLKTESRGIVEFECRNQTEYELWTQGVSKLLSIGAQRKRKCTN